jgi:hypothetical protein
MRAIVGPDLVTGPAVLPHGHRELLATAPCAPVDLGRLIARWTSSCWLPADTPLEVLLDGRYGSHRSALNVAEAVRAWFLGELPRLRRAGLSLTMDVRCDDAALLLHADGLGTVALPIRVGCSGPTDAARAISRLATRRPVDPDGALPPPVDPVVRVAHARLCEEHLVRSVRTVFPTDVRTVEAVRRHHPHRDAFERATAGSVLWLSRLVIVSEGTEPTREQLAWFREACNVSWPDEQIMGLWRSFPELATRINGRTLETYLLGRAGGRTSDALACIDHLAVAGPGATAATIAEAAAWARLRRQDASACA